MAIPKDAPHQELAEKFINFILEPEIGAKISNYSPYESPTSRFVADFIGETNFLTGRVIERQVSAIVVLVDEQLPVSVTSVEDIAIGQIVTLVIRPEKVAIHPSGYTEKCELKRT